MDKVTETENLLTREWDVIASAPFSFLAALLVVAGIIWVAVWLIHRGQINALKSKNDAKQDHLNFAQDKLARAEGELAKSPPTDESSDQKAIIASTLAETVRAELAVLRGELGGARMAAGGSRIVGHGEVFGPVPFEDIDRPKKDTDNSS